MLLDTTASAIVTGVSAVFTALASVATWFWGLFGDFLGLFLENPLLLIPVGFGILAGAISLVIGLVRKFGVRGKR